MKKVSLVVATFAIVATTNAAINKDYSNVPEFNGGTLNAKSEFTNAPPSEIAVGMQWFD